MMEKTPRSHPRVRRHGSVVYRHIHREGRGLVAQNGTGSQRVKLQVIFRAGWSGFESGDLP